MDVLSGRFVTESNVSPFVAPVDFGLFSFGFHNHTLFHEAPQGEKYYQAFVERWLRLRQNTTVPTAWVSMNDNCKEKKLAQFQYQAEDIRIANHYTHKTMTERKLPYFDSDSVLRTANHCAESMDGVHVKLWVDMVRAKILLNHLCDDDWNWIGGDHMFIK